jgi:serine/threonine-protein kinase
LPGVHQGAPTSSETRARAAPVAPGDILAGKYRVERVLGAGGMGVVVAATHIDLMERRAIKFMLPSQLGDAEAVERFLREARASSKLRGEHVARVHDVGRLDTGAPYMVMEYLTGGDLRALLAKRGALSAGEAALYVLQACEALAEAHGAGIVHRDVKPENLFLTRRPDGTPSIKVLDFGISKHIGEGHELALTSAEAIMGSPYYMSPEQLRASRDVDARADIWSLGVILYQLVTNNLPFEGNNLTALIADVMFAGYHPASKMNPALGTSLDAIIARCLAKEAEARYPSVAELAEDLLPLAPPTASQSIERIHRLLQPSPAEGGNPLSVAPPAIPAATPGLPVAETYRSQESPVGKAKAGVTPLAVSGPHAFALGDSSGGTLLSGRGAALSPPSRTPMLILAVGGALALLIASLAFLLGRTHPSATVVQSASAAPTSTAAPTTTLAPLVTPTEAPSTGPAQPVVSVTPAPSEPTTPPPLASHSGHHTGTLPGKPPTKGTATAGPTKPPSSPDPFGEGRQ